MEKQVVEYAGVPVGITVPDGDRVKFIAVKFPVIELDGGSYSSITELRRAIHAHMSSSSGNGQTGAGPGNMAGGNTFNAA
ncbi:hypothetical protein ACQQ2Q_01505 [Agrobacterium sp. ES01]|uniref:hypothetical protein n=1 Tax=Agrobacterium sp. ES01 TaxID=3420714 RepID=UPI003D0B4F3A